MSQIKKFEIKRRETLEIIVSVDLSGLNWLETDSKINAEISKIEVPEGDWNLVKKSEGFVVDDVIDITLILEREI